MSVRLRAVVLFAMLLAAWSVTPAPSAEAVGSSQPPPLPSVSAGGYFTCAVDAGGLAACWGENGVPANDVANTSPGGGANPPAGLRFLEVNSGYATSCGITTTNTISCWGSGRYDKFVVPAGTFTHVAPGLNYICALRTDQTIACWGGDDLDPTQLVLNNIPTGTFTQVSIGNRNACALRTDQTIACWGVNTDGQNNAPTGTFRWVNISNFSSCALRTDGTPVCWGRNQGLQQTYPAGETFTQVSTGFAHVCGLRSDGTAVCWGRSSEGQTVVPAGTYTQISAGTFHTCAVPTSGPPVRCWGNNAAGRVQPSMSNIPPPPGYVGRAYLFQLRMGTYISPTPEFSVTSGALPAGVTLSPAGQLSGTPSTPGSYTFTVAASSRGLSPTDCSNVSSSGDSRFCTPGDPDSVATATRVFTIVIGAVAPDPGSINGTVTSASGPTGGATVTVTSSGGAPAGQATTDSNGSYQVGDLLPGDYSVTASGTELQPQTKPATVTSNTTTTVDFSLTPLIRPTITGVFLNHFETVSDGVFVQWSESIEQRLNQPSSYTIHQQANCADTALATAFRGNWLATRPTIRDLEMTGFASVVPGGTYYLRAAPDAEFGLTTGQRNALQCVQFVAALRTVDQSTVAGVVSNSAGTPIAGATVTVTRTVGAPGTVAGQGTTDGTGSYSIGSLPPGPYTVNVSAPGHYGQTANVTTTGGATSTVGFVLQAAPVAGGDTYTHYGSDTPLVIPAAGVLANDTDVDGGMLTAGVVTGPLKGSLVLSPNGSFVYQPDEDQLGSVTFTYRSSDGTGSSNTATVTVNVAAGCRGTAATLTGTSGRNRLVGTSGVDVIAGQGGDDTINGQGSNDIVCGGSGKDDINAGGGNDYADGGSGNDNLDGAGGDDTLLGGDGSDALLGGDGVDVLSGGAGTNDRCRGGSGLDTLAADHGCETTVAVP